jgi:hypothetical protein
MKKIIAMALVTMGLTANAIAAEFKGFVEDTSCANVPSMKNDAACAQKCIKGGSPAVLVTADGMVYKIANQEKIVSRAGENVIIDGTLKGDTITIASVK